MPCPGVNICDAWPARRPAGVLQTLCFIFKLGHRDRLLPFAPAAWSQLLAVMDSAQLAANVLARKLATKLLQRVGLTFLKPRLAPWRYVREDASLDRTLAGKLLPRLLWALDHVFSMLQPAP